MAKRKKVFNGKEYEEFRSYSTKKEADESAKNNRIGSYFARVVKSKNKFIVFIRFNPDSEHMKSFNAGNKAVKAYRKKHK